VAFGEAIFAKSLDLLEAAFGEGGRITACHHPPTSVPDSDGSCRYAEGGHGPAQAVGLRRREAGRSDRQLHRLLLEQGNTQRLFEHIAQFVRGIGRAGIFHRLLTIAAAQIGWTIPPWIGPGGRSQPGSPDRRGRRASSAQHGNLGAAFDLESADAVALRSMA